jgi:hypothetical protein
LNEPRPASTEPSTIVDNRLSAEQLGALAPGGVVTIEISGDFRKPRYSTGTVVRLEGSCVVLSWRSPRGVPYVHRYDLRRGVRIGGGHHAQIVKPQTAEAAPTDDGAPAPTKDRRPVPRVDPQPG